MRKRFPVLEDRDNLWSLLASITARKAINQRKRQLAAKRGGGMQLDTSQRDVVARLVDEALTPAHVAAMSEQCRRLMQALNEPTLERIARSKLEGYANEEIAQQLGVALRTIERKLNRIRHIWTEMSEES